MIHLWWRLAATTESCWSSLRRSEFVIWELNHRLTLHKSPSIKAFERSNDILMKILHARLWLSTDRRMQFWVPTCCVTFHIFIRLLQGSRFCSNQVAYSCLKIRIFAIYSTRRGT